MKANITIFFPVFMALATLLFSGCQSASRVERYYDVEVGSTKGEVLERMGSPGQTTRVHGMDNWYYDLRPHSMRRVFIFDEGVLSYKGPILPPALTAAEEDEIYEPTTKLSPRAKNYKRPHSDKELRDILRKEVEKKSPKKPGKFEKI